MYPPSAYDHAAYGPQYAYNGDPRASPYARPESTQAPPASDHYDSRNAAAPQYHYDSRQGAPPLAPQYGAENCSDGRQAAQAPDPYHYDSQQSAPPTAGYPPHPGQDPYYDAYYRSQQQQYASGGYPPAASYPSASYPSASYPSSGSSGYYGQPDPGYPPPGGGSGYPSSSGYPPPTSSYPPPAGTAYPPLQSAGYSPPPHGYPPPAGYPPPEAYAAPPPGAGYGPPPVGYGPQLGHAAPPQAPGYGMPPPPPGYGPPSSYAPPAGYMPAVQSSRGPSPRRDGGKREWSDVNQIPVNTRSGQRDNRRGGKGENRQGGKGGRGDRFGDDSRRPNGRNSGDPKSRLQHWLQIHSGWMALWLEGIDPPRRMASAPNVTLLMVANSHFQKGGGEEFGFIFSTSRAGAKKKDREKECAKDIVGALDQLPLDDMRAWCQMPDASDAKRAVEANDLQNLTTLVRRRCPKVVSVSLPEPAAFVLVAACPWGPHERAHGADAELAVLERFDAGFAELLREARRVSGLVRKQWFVAVVWAYPEPNDNARPITLGIGLATDRDLAKARAVHAAEVRSHVVTEAMFAALPAGPKVVGPPEPADTKALALPLAAP